MKKVIIIILSMLLIGCSNVKKSEDNLNKPIDHNENKVQSDNNLQNTRDTSLLDNIDTTNNPFEKGYYDYSGYINSNLAIKMSIYPLDNEIVGSYFYDSKKIKIKLKGKASNKDFVLYEYDESGENTGIFKGTMTTIDKIEGTWVTPDGSKSYPFELTLNQTIKGCEYGKRYAVAGITKSDDYVENYASEIQDYIINNNKEKLAENISYPININIDGTNKKIENKDEFIKNYNKIANSDFKNSISKTSTKYLFANWKGILLGEDSYNMMINESNEKLMITSINNGNQLDSSLDNITEKTKDYIMNGQGEKSSAEKIKWSKTFLDKVDIENLYKSYLMKGGKADNLEDFAKYMTKYAPIPDDWQDLFAKDLFNEYGYKLSRVEPLDDYPDYYQAYVIINGTEKPFVVVSARTGDFHG